MGWQIIPEGDGKYSIFSTITDTILYNALTEADARKLYTEEAIYHATKQAMHEMDNVFHNIGEQGYGYLHWHNLEEARELHKQNVL